MERMVIKNLHRENQKLKEIQKEDPMEKESLKKNRKTKKRMARYLKGRLQQVTDHVQVCITVWKQAVHPKMWQEDFAPTKIALFFMG